MPLLVHVTAERNVAAIRRAGITFPKWRPGVYAMPVLQNFVVSHQWMRELKRDGARTMHGVYFRIPDRERVLFGHFNQAPVELTAAEAVGQFMKTSDPLGMQIIVPRKIAASEVRRIQQLPNNLGWRYSPGAHKLVFCGCAQCNPPGLIKSTLKRRRWERRELGARTGA